MSNAADDLTENNTTDDKYDGNDKTVGCADVASIFWTFTSYSSSVRLSRPFNLVRKKVRTRKEAAKSHHNYHRHPILSLVILICLQVGVV